MKKLVLAAAIAAVASNAMALEVYNAEGTTVKVFGEIRSLLTDSDEKKASFNMSDTQFGVQVSHAINEDLTATGRLEYDADHNDDDSKLEVNDGWLSLNSKQYNSTIKIGNQGSVYDSLLGSYDASYEQGGSAALGEDADGTGTIESAVTYTWSDDSFTVMGQYSLTDEEARTFGTVAAANMDSTAALGASWASDFGLTLSGVYSLATYDHLSDAPIVNSKELDIVAVGFEADYSVGPWTVGAIVSKVERETDKDKEFQNEDSSLGLGVNYAFESGMNVFAGYDVVRNENTSKAAVKAANEVETTSYNVGVDYKFHPSVKVFAEYGHETAVTEAAGKDSTNNTDKWNIGARVYF